MFSTFLDYFRCPPELCNVEVTADLPAEGGFFRLGEAVCYGRQATVPSLAVMNGRLPHDVSAAVRATAEAVELPFDLDEVVTNLREERYRPTPNGLLSTLLGSSAVRGTYYALRPGLPTPIRRHVQRLGFRNWDRIPFPRWPVDASVDALLREALRALLAARPGTRLPFVWFWPEGAPACAMMTHDVESRAGLAFCDRLMDIDDEAGVKSSFQVIPEGRSELSTGLVRRFRERGFEVNVHDLNHDGRLYQHRELFLERMARINGYAREFGCRGFRSGAMYRRQDWFDAMGFDYDMSVPNVAHLEPQRGGCCTVMPYFVGRVLELPLTTAQDYHVFHLMGAYTTDLWQRQIELILAHHGLISFIAHPDYLQEHRAQAVYRQLLERVRALRESRGVWVALPGEVDAWWRGRQRMRLVAGDGGWRVEGPGSDRARVAFARLDGDHVVYEVDQGR
jgi:hypothetical protein